MQELIRVYNNAMRPELCDSIIAYYDDNEKDLLYKEIGRGAQKRLFFQDTLKWLIF